MVTYRGPGPRCCTHALVRISLPAAEVERSQALRSHVPLLLVTAGGLETGGKALLWEYIVKFGAISNE